MPFVNICSNFLGSLFKHNDRMDGISDVTSRHKFYCIACIKLSYFSTLKAKDFWVKIEDRLKNQILKHYRSGLSMLIPQEGEKTWGEKRKANKCDMLSSLTGYRHRINNGRDKLYMKKYLEKVSRTGRNKTKSLEDQEFLPLGAPLYWISWLKTPRRWMDGSILSWRSRRCNREGEVFPWRFWSKLKFRRLSVE